jgi:phosphonoacetate hydrolase
MMDKYLARLDTLGATIALTADHGMNAKHGPDGQPNVLYLQDLLDSWLGTDVARVILPITDPYVVHHGALGSFATVYLPATADVAGLVQRLGALPGIEMALDRVSAAVRVELPEDRIGNIVIVAERQVVIGTSAARHDLSGLDAPLRSHGGLSEQQVPLLCNRKVTGVDADRHLRNFDAFDLVLNHID